MISLRIKNVDGFIGKTVGLIGFAKPYPILLKTRFGIHTFFLKFPIDVVILDAYNNVVFLKESMMPNRIFLWNPKYDTVLELPAGTIISKKIALGKQIKIVGEK